MADYPAPVATQIQPPDPMRGLNTFSALLGIKQKQQQLQTGQYLQQTAQAESSQAQQKNAELQALAGVTREAMKPGSRYWHNGEFDTDAYRADATGVAPIYGPQAVDQHISTIKNVVDTREAFLKLGAESNKTMSDALKGLATKQGPITDTDIDTFADNMKSTVGSNPEGQYRLGQLVGAMRGAQSPQARQAVARNSSAMLGGFMQQTAGTVDEGAAVQPTLTSVWGGSAPVGEPFGKGQAPQFVSPPGGVPTAVGGIGHLGVGNTQTAPNQTGGGKRNLSGFAGPQPTAEEMSDFGAYQKSLNNRVAVASNSLPRIQMLEQALQNVRTGAGSEVRAGIAQKMQAIGMPQSAVDAVAGGNLAGIQEAEKLLFQTTLSGLEQSMSGDPHVAQFNAAKSVFPSVNTDPRAREVVLGFLRDQGNRDYAEQQAMRDARNKGTLSPPTWQADWQKQLREGAPGVPESQKPQTAGKGLMSKSGRSIKKVGDHYEYAD